jgi:hypothetical protein
VGSVAITCCNISLGYEAGTPLGYIWYAFLLIAPWIYYPIQKRKLDDEFMPDEDFTYHPTDEGLRYEWELNYLAQKERKKRGDPE